MGIVYEQMALLDQAVVEYIEARRRFGEPVASLNALQKSYEIDGWKGFWKKALQLSQAASINKSSSPVRSAEIYARLGEKDLAFQELEKAYRDRELRLIEINVKSELTSLRSDLRFKDLLRRMNLVK